MLGIVATPVLGRTSETAPPPHRSFKQRLLFFLLTHLGWLVILILGRLTRIRYIGREHRDRLSAVLPLVGAMHAPADEAAAFVCRDFACQAPVSDPAALDGLLA